MYEVPNMFHPPQKGIISGMLPNEYNEGYLYPIMSCFWRREGWGAMGCPIIWVRGVVG